MGAHSQRTYLVLSNAPEVGLAFTCPPTWDLEALAERYPERRVTLSPEDGEALLLSWAHVLRWNQAESRWEENIPRRERDSHREGGQTGEAILRALEKAEWLIIHRGQVWVVPKEAGDGAAILEGPVWWFVPNAYRAFAQRYRGRFIEEKNPFWLDETGLLTGREAREWDGEARLLHRAWCREVFGRDWNAFERKEMRRFARLLEQTVWVVVYDYEWESGLE